MLVYSSDLCNSLCCINHPLDAALWITTTKLNTQCTVIPPYLPCYCTQPTAVFASMTWFHSFTQGMGGAKTSGGGGGWESGGREGEGGDGEREAGDGGTGRFDVRLQAWEKQKQHCCSAVKVVLFYSIVILTVLCVSSIRRLTEWPALLLQCNNHNNLKNKNNKAAHCFSAAPET